MTIHRQFISILTIITMLVMVFGIVVGSAQAVSPPNIVTYQGRVLDANGVPVSSSSLSMKFFLYTAATGGTCVWSNSSGTCHSNTPASTTARTVTITNGLFTENLGDTAASTPYAAIADSTFADNASIYLAVEIAGETLSPRKQLVAAPYAFNADTLDGIDLSVIQLWEVGTGGSYEDDAAAIVGADAAFSYGSGGVGDLRVADQLEVMDDGFIDNDFIVGASTSSTETITNAGFTLGGNDLFVASDVGIEGNLYLDGDVAVDGDDLTADGDLTITGATGLNLVATTGTLDLTTSAAANITATLGGAANVFNVLTGNLKIGNGTPTNVQDGEDVYIDSMLEVAGDAMLYGRIGVNSSSTSDSFINNTSTGDFIVYDNGSAFATFTDAGAILISLDATDNPAFTLTDSGTSDVTFNLASTGDFVVQDNGTAALTVNDSGNVTVVNTATVGDLACTDCIDFAEMVDAMSLDANSSIAQDGTETFTLSNGGSGNTIVNVASTGDFVIQDNGTDYFTFNDDRSIDYSSNQSTTDPFDFTVDSVTSGNGMDFSADGLTTGRGLYVTSTSGSLSSADLSAMATSGTYTASATVTGNVIDLSRSLIVSDGSAGTISNLNVTSPVATISDNCASAGNDVCTTSGNVLLLTQSFTSSGNVLGISNAGTGDTINIAGAGTGTAIDIDATTYTIDLEMQNGLTIDNDDDNDLNIIENSLTLNFDFGEATADEIGYSSANDLNFISTSTNSDSLVLFANGSGGGVTIIGGSAATDAGENGNDVALEAGDDVLIDSGDDVGFGMADDATFTLAAGGNVMIDAATTDQTSITGALDINFDSSTDFASGINLAVTAIDDDAADSIIGLFIDQAIQNDTSATDTVYGAMINVTNLDTAAAGTGLYIEVDDDGAGVVNSGITISNAQSTDIDLSDAILVRATISDSIVDAVDVSDAEITNAFNAGQNFIVLDATRMFSSSGAIIWEDTSGNDLMTLTDNSNVGDLVLTGDLQVNGGDITTASGALAINPATYTRIGDNSTPGSASTDDDFYASGALEVDGTSYFDGIVDIDFADAWTTTTTGILEVDIIAGDAAVYAQHVALTQGNGATTGREATAFGILLDAEDQDGNLIGLDVRNQAGTSAGVAGNYEALIRITNTEAVASIVTDAILIEDTSSTAGTIVDAIDVSDTEITNAINAAANFIVFDTTREFGSSTGVITWEDTSGNDLMTLTDNTNVGDLVLTGDLQVNGSDITTSSGALTINPATYTRIGDVSTPGNASTDDDLYVSGALEVDGTSHFDGIVDIDLAGSSTTTTTGILEMDITAGDAAVFASHIALTQANGATISREATAFGILLDAEDQDGNLIGLDIRNQAGVSAGVAGNYEALLRLVNVESVAAIVTDAILIEDTSSTAGTIVDAIDVSDTEITNAMNIGANNIIGSTGLITFSGATTWSSTGGDVTVQANGEGIDLLLAGGDTLQSARSNGNDVEIFAEDDLLITNTDDTNLALAASGTLVLDASTTAHTDTNAGAFDLNLSTVGGSGAGSFVRGMTVDTTVTDNDAANSVAGAEVTITSTSNDGDTIYGLSVVNADSGDDDQVITAGIRIRNLDSTADDDFSAGILFGNLNSGGFLRGLDFNGASVDTAEFRLSGGEQIHNVGGTAITLEDGDGTDIFLGSTTALQMNLNDSNDYSEVLCHSGADEGTGIVGIGDCNVSGGGADLAEFYGSNGTLKPGDVVVPTGVASTLTQEDGTFTSKAFVTRTTRAYETRIVGIVSTDPGLLMAEGVFDESDFAVPVALAGRIPVNVTNENGLIQAGDYLTTSSTSGYAMKATGVGRVIGMALADFNGSIGQVLAQVNNGWYLGDVISSDGSSTVVTDKAVMAPLRPATASEPRIDSYGFALRGSAWNGAEAQAVEMLLKTTVTDANSYRLSVRNTTDTEIAYITNTGTMQVSGDMVITGKLYPSDRGIAQADKYIYYDGSEGAGGDFMRTNAKGWSTGSYDFAEMFPSDDTLQAGEVVVFAESGQRVSRSMEAGSARIVGIVSTRPGFLAGDNSVGSHPIALAGRVPTRVTSENGEVKVGDPLTTSSKPGYAMKATESGMIVGYALEPVVSDDASILVYVNVGYWGGEATSIIPGTNNQASGFASGTNVNYSTLNMTGNIYVSGNEILSVGRIAGIGDVWSIDQDGTMKTEGLLKVVTRSHADEKVETIAVTSPEAVITLTGTAKLSDGQAEVRFEDFEPSFNDVTAADAPLRVIVTPSGPVSLYVSEKDNNHFVVKQFAGESADVEFDWMVIAYRKGYEPQQETEEVLIDHAPPVSPDTTIVDSLTEDEGGTQAEQPSESVVEPAQSESETTLGEEISSVQEDVTESGT